MNLEMATGEIRTLLGGEMKEVEEWMKKAEGDLRAAEINLHQGLLEVSAFLSHQAAEKALKAIHILKFKRLWRIHDLEKLCLSLGAGKEMAKICGELNPHYVETRYPVEREYTREIAKSALENARRVLAWAKRKSKRSKSG